MTGIITAKQTRRSAALFNWGCIVAVLVPMPFFILWFGGSILVYTLNRQHPDPRVGRYTQRAATRFYGVAGALIVLGKFVPEDDSTLMWYLLLWGLGVLILVPWSLYDIYRIWHEDWHDIVHVPEEA